MIENKAKSRMKSNLKGGTKSSRVASLVNSAAKSAGHGKQTNVGNKMTLAAVKNGKGAAKKFKK